MKQWQETREIVQRAAEALAAGRRAALATVVHIDGSAYRRPGAKLLIERSGVTRGGVSGGCLEADVREMGLEAIRGAVARLREYRTGADEDTVWGLGLGCDGTVHVFVQPLEPGAAEVWEAVMRLLDGDDPFALSTVLAGPAAGRSVVWTHGNIVAGSTGRRSLDVALARHADGLVPGGRSERAPVDSTDVFTEVLAPPPWLVIIGAGDDAIPLADLATATGFRVAVVDHRPAYLDRTRFPDALRRIEARAERPPPDLLTGRDSYAVVMTHALAHDREWVRHLLQSPVRYIGVLGPRRRIASMLDELGNADDARVFGPVGLDIGADGAEQIAVSVLAEVLAIRAACSPQHLRERPVSIHAQ